MAYSEADYAPLNTAQKERDAWDWVWMLTVWSVTAVLLWPATRWLAQRIGSSDQLMHAFLVLAFASVFLIREQGMKPQWILGAWAVVHLFIAYGLVAVAMVFHRPEPMLVAYCAGLAALLFTVYGRAVRRLAYSALGTFLVFLLLIGADARLDWPLRAMAGRTSGWFLGLMGQETTLQLVQQDEPKLVLAVNGHLFEVAAECNGFGLIGGSVLLAVLLVLFRRVRWFDKVLSVFVALLLAFIINSLRIVLISLLAPHVGSHYMLMHEIVGTTLFGAGLLLVWWLVSGLPVAANRQDKATNFKSN